MSTVLISGANRGLGLEFARHYAQAGDTVIGACREPHKAGALRELRGVEVVALDVSSADSVAALAGQLRGRPIDLLINNAGRLERGRPGHSDPEAVLGMLRTNTLGPLMLSEALAESLSRSPRPVIVTVSSGLGSLSDNSSGGHLGYRVSKAAVNMVMRTLAADLAPRGITCVLLTPGWVSTDMGGPGAPLKPAESVRGMCRVIDGLRPEHSGRWYDYTGQESAW